MGYITFSEKDDEIVTKNYQDNDDKNEEYQELINVKGLEDVIRRKEFLFNVKIDRSQNKVEEIPNNENNLVGGLGADNKDENKDKNNDEKKDDINKEENKDKEKEIKDDKEKEKEKDIDKEKVIKKEEKE